MPFWKWLAGRYGRYYAWLAYNLWNGASNALYIFVLPQDWVMGIIVTFLNGLALGGKFLSDATLADTIEYDEFLTGERREAQFTVFSSLVPKLVSIPSQALPLAIISALGFIPSFKGCDDEGAVATLFADQPEAVTTAIRYIFVLFPVTANLVSFGVKTKYPIKRASQMDEISAGISIHKLGRDFEDPLTGNVVPSSIKLTEQEKVDGIDLDHFYAGEKRTIMVNHGDVGSVIGGIVSQVAVSLIIVVASIVGVLKSFFLLESETLSWVPCLLQILIGLSVLSLAFHGMRLKKAIQLSKQKPFKVSFVRKWIKRTNAGVGGDDDFDEAGSFLIRDADRIIEDLQNGPEDEAPSARDAKAAFKKAKTMKRPPKYTGSVRNIVPRDEEEEDRIIENILSTRSLV
mmetsp:Transcript_54767/g.119820  ORF Transcript_54767/g.119820 Transcript_54767/m.119820 type:complete len:402 (+) Transcript_54767:3-1208(+)